MVCKLPEKLDFLQSFIYNCIKSKILVFVSSCIKQVRLSALIYSLINVRLFWMVSKTFVVHVTLFILTLDCLTLDFELVWKSDVKFSCHIRYTDSLQTLNKFVLYF